MGHRTGRLVALTAGLTATACLSLTAALLPASATAGSQPRPTTDTHGQGSAPQEAPSYAKPGAPDQVTAQLAPGGVRVSWASVSAQPAVTRYVVHAGPGSCPVTVRAGATSAILPVVAGQTVITPTVEAVNPYGFSAGATAPTVDVTGRASSRYVNLQVLQLSDFHGAIQASPTSAGAPAGRLPQPWARGRHAAPT
jgi:hypothetical protein